MNIIEAIQLAITNPAAVIDEFLGRDNLDVDNDEEITLTRQGKEAASEETKE
jgi:hypothetical protein